MSKNDDALRCAEDAEACGSFDTAAHIRRLVAENEALQHYRKVYGQVSGILACTAEMPPLSDDDEITVQRLKMLVESHNTYVDSCEAKADRIDRLGEAVVKLRSENEALCADRDSWAEQAGNTLNAFVKLRRENESQAALLRQAVEAMAPVSGFGRVGSRDVEQAELQRTIAAIRQHLEGKA